MFIATLVAQSELRAGDISAACDAVGGWAGRTVDGMACDVRFAGDARTARAALEDVFRQSALDVFVQVEAERRRRLLVADMDSTMITVECIDELADYAGVKSEVSAVTEAAMRGELDFQAALVGRVALLKGLQTRVMTDCLRERVKISPGAQVLVSTVKSKGGSAVLVSGGFTDFAVPIAARIGFDRAVANRLVIEDGVLTGEVQRPIVDAATKKTVLVDELSGRDPAISIAIGDGANDIPLIAAAGIGVAYHAKPTTQAAADASIRHGDLSALLYAMGWPRSEWVPST